MKKIVLTLLLLSFTNLLALQESALVATMQTKVDFATKVLSKKDVSLDEKAKEIFSELESVFDINLMGKLALSSYWKSLSTDEQKEYLSAFDSYMKKSYMDKLKLYNNEKITIKDAQKVNDKRIWLHSEIQGEKEVFKVIYKFYKTDSDNWLIYDVDIIGVSIIKTYKAQFEDTMANGSFKDLMAKLKN